MPPEERQSLRVRFAYSRPAAALRRGRARVDNREVREGRNLARLIRGGPLDVLLFGDSVAAFTAPYDADPRPLHTMMRDAFGQDVTSHAVFGAGFKPLLFEAYARQLEGHPSPPLVIIPLMPRLSSFPWVEHPVYGHRRATRFLSTVDGSTPLNKIRTGFPAPTQADFDRFHELRFTTWAGDLRIGDYIRQLKGGDLSELDAAKLLYAYHYGGTLDADSAPVDALRSLGQRLRGLGAQVIVYQSPLPVEKGVELHGEAFRDLAERNFEVLETAFTTGYGEVPVVRIGLESPTSHFVDWRDGTEHLNEVGRSSVVDAVMAAATALRS